MRGVPGMRGVLGPLPCRGCRVLVVLTSAPGSRRLVTKATGVGHTCEPEPVGASFFELRALYGEEEALVRLAGMRRVDDRERARKRESARRRRARVA